MTVRKVLVAGQMLDVSGAGYEPDGEYSLDGSRVEPPQDLIETLQAAVLASDASIERSETGGGGSFAAIRAKGRSSSRQGRPACIEGTTSSGSSRGSTRSRSRPRASA